ncbi:MAG: T9SS type A sorting domain-containing protein [Chlamydiia bacterium]|nr:T9SS type A sorting domain-containing protein [Chlamydiia bacterium]
MKRFILSAVLVSLLLSIQAQTTRRMVPDSIFAITMQQDTLSLDSLRDQYQFVMFEFYFAESELCKETSPSISQAYKDLGYNNNDVFILSINVGNNNSECQNYIDTLSLETPMASGLQGGGNIVTDSFNIQSYPTIILIGADNIGEEIISIDTADNGDIDTTWGDYNYNIYEQDIWPIYSSNDILEVLAGYGITGLFTAPQIKEVAFQIYPNPNNGQFFVRTEDLDLNQIIEYQIIDISGKLLQEGKLNNSTETSVNITGLKTGIYFYRIKTKSKYFTQKLIIQ